MGGKGGKTKLNIGCGFDKLEGFVNIDKNPKSGSDRVCDIEKGIPFNDNTFDFILCKQVLEHIDDIIFVMKEIHRIAKPDATVHVEVPHYKSEMAFESPTHRRFFTEHTFDYWNPKNPWCVEVDGDECPFSVVSVKKVRGSINPFHIHGLVFILKVVK